MTCLSRRHECIIVGPFPIDQKKCQDVAAAFPQVCHLRLNAVVSAQHSHPRNPTHAGSYQCTLVFLLVKHTKALLTGPSALTHALSSPIRTQVVPGDIFRLNTQVTAEVPMRLFNTYHKT